MTEPFPTCAGLRRLTSMVLQMTQASTPPAKTGKCCSRKVGDMTRPVVLMKSVMKKWRMLVNWCRQCSCWSVDDSITPATNAPNSDDKPCRQFGLFHAYVGSTCSVHCLFQPCCLSARCCRCPSSAAVKLMSHLLADKKLRHSRGWANTYA